jgi:catechol 2,3-dioxygenase-like lactoylglutathione lyase family enzyme
MSGGYKLIRKVVMRDPNRIDQVLDALREIWINEPDLRLGQLIVNAVGSSEPCSSVYAIEDYVLMRRLEEYPSAHVQEQKARDVPRLSLAVIRSSNLEKSRAFYTALGLQLSKEKHGDGPEHYSCALGEAVFEIYPAKRNEKTTRQIRLGFCVASLDETMDVIPSLSGRIVSPPARSPWGYRSVVSDPDGHKVELVEA